MHSTSSVSEIPNSRSFFDALAGALPDIDERQRFMAAMRGHLHAVLHGLTKARSTLTAGCIGWLVGEMVDNIPIVGYLTQDQASSVGAIIGSLFGLPQDLERHWIYQSVQFSVVSACRDIGRPELATSILRQIKPHCPNTDSPDHSPSPGL